MSDMKCPICGSKMSVSYGSGEGLFSCSNLLCKAGGFYATDEMWQELIRTRKALEITVDALNTVTATPLNSLVIHDVANKALDQIIAMEQKDVK